MMNKKTIEGTIRILQDILGGYETIDDVDDIDRNLAFNLVYDELDSSYSYSHEKAAVLMQQAINLNKIDKLFM